MPEVSIRDRDVICYDFELLDTLNTIDISQIIDLAPYFNLIENEVKNGQKRLVGASISR